MGHWYSMLLKLRDQRNFSHMKSSVRVVGVISVLFSL